VHWDDIIVGMAVIIVSSDTGEQVRDTVTPDQKLSGRAADKRRVSLVRPLARAVRRSNIVRPGAPKIKVHVDPKLPG
jgi:hypothetical protein